MGTSSRGRDFRRWAITGVLVVPVLCRLFLVPRPETELLVSLALDEIPRDAAWEILDLGTSSGAVAVSIACERPLCQVTAVDVSEEALAVARENARALAAGGGEVEVFQQDARTALAALADRGRRFDIVYLDPPYGGTVAYETALRDSGIPYLSAGKSLLLDTLEVRDLEALLNLLLSPYDNLALAQVLRSPLFNLDSEALVALAALQAGTWYDRLAILAGRGEAPWNNVYRMLSGWRALAGQVPVHDLLDRIYHEADVLQRYLAAYPATLQPRARASLTRFIELAGEINTNMPYFVVQRVAEALNEHGQALKGARILVLGAAYKKDVDDPRESPGLKIISLLQSKGAEVWYHDPHIPHLRGGRNFPDLELKSVDLTAENLSKADCVLLVTDHSVLDYGWIASQARVIVDTRNAFAGQPGAPVFLA